MIIVFFPDFIETEVVYHVACITDLKNILKNGIRYDDKATYYNNYLEFHKYINSFKPKAIPDWVNREKAIFASMNYPRNHNWHSHTAVLAVKINKRKCWIANENLANMLYEPFILKSIKGFEVAKEYLDSKGKDVIAQYWNTSLSFCDNLSLRRDKEVGYDEEVMIFHDIEPEDITLLRVISDHRTMTVKECIELYKGT
ncbi:hypothetical protein SAMN05660462_01818 [Proteiniborus ethanoligenes]|uniref:Uncharacterized protein n=1 Tax=Proteiniborus ethanoligenes TaxID=415015 RepID=A0A1H3Q6Q3_9FIRM|nr:hypothetical protein [Proteiniborus ethanoligenes]SDZ08861.1 hypothetical protein SAMN05660462_01818 [Proteiniborus ethanoligenes]